MHAFVKCIKSFTGPVAQLVREAAYAGSLFRNFEFDLLNSNSSQTKIFLLCDKGIVVFVLKVRALGQNLKQTTIFYKLLTAMDTS